MKYLISKRLSNKDAKKFMREHEGCRFMYESLLWAPIVESLPADIDAIVCYQDDAEEYGKFDKKIITVKALNS